jgi:hypothetical protein
MREGRDREGPGGAGREWEGGSRFFLLISKLARSTPTPISGAVLGAGPCYGQPMPPKPKAQINRAWASGNKPTPCKM